MKRTTIFLGDADRQAIQTIQERFGVASDSDAIRLALRVLAQAERVTIEPVPAAEPYKGVHGDKTPRS